jgi:tetratricopeptide (TPR) repeat protein
MNWGSYYIFWFLAPVILSAVSAHPSILIIAVVALLARRWLPDPYLYFKYSKRIDFLRSQIDLNADNLAARRELALIYLEKRRPAKALALLEALLEREPEAADLLYLHGRALLGAGRPEEAVARFVAAVSKDHKLAYGEPYLRAGDALVKLRRLEDAEEAYQRLTEVNRSSVEGRAKLGLVRRARRDADGARQAFADARSTYRQLPRFQRRKQWWWRLRAWWAS